MKTSTKSTLRRAAALAASTVLLTAVAACGGSDGGSKSSGGGGSDEAAASSAQERVDEALKPQAEIAITTPLKAAPSDKKVAYFIRYNLEAANAVAVWPDIVKKAGWEGRILAIDPTDPQAASNAIEQAISAGADYIVVHANGETTVKAGLAKAKAAKVPVFFVSGVGEVGGEKNGLYGNVQTVEGVAKNANTALDWAIADANGAANVLWVSYPDAEVLKLQEEITHKNFEKACPKCTWQRLDLSNDQINSPDATVSELRKNTDIKYVATSFAPSTFGLRKALDAAGLNDVKIILGSGDSKAHLDALRVGDVDIVDMFGVPDALFSSLDQLLRMDQGMDVEQSIHGPSNGQLFTKDTVGDADTWPGPDGYEEQYLKLWQIS